MPKFLTEDKLFLIIFLVGLGLRIAALPTRDFWFDEAFTFHIAKLPIKDLILAVASDNNPPFYYLLIHYLLKISHNEIFLRIPSLIAGVLTVLFLYFFVKEEINKKVALISASLILVSPLAIYLSSEARPHSIAVLFTGAAAASFLALIKKPKMITVITFILISILGVYTQYYIILLFLPFTWTIMSNRTSIGIKSWLIISLIILAALAFWLIFSAAFEHSSCFCPNTLIALPTTLVSSVIGGVGIVTLSSFIKLHPLIFSLFSATTALTILLFIIGVVRHLNFAKIYLLPLIGISFVGLFLPIFSAKAFTIFSPFFLANTAYGLSTLRQKTTLTILLFCLFFAVSVIQLFNPFFAGERLKPIFDVVSKDQATPVAHTSLVTYYSLNFYAHNNLQNFLLTENPLSSHTLKFIGGTKQEIDNQVNKLWLVDTQKWTDKVQRQTVLDKIFNNFHLEDKYQVGNIEISYLKRK